jgi:hypothetical protein
MNGKLKIKVKGHKIQVKGYLANAGLCEQTAIVDAVMNTFQIHGEKRVAVCGALMHADDARSKKDEPETEKEEEQNEG